MDTDLVKLPAQKGGGESLLVDHGGDDGGRKRPTKVHIDYVSHFAATLGQRFQAPETKGKFQYGKAASAFP